MYGGVFIAGKDNTVRLSGIPVALARCVDKELPIFLNPDAGRGSANYAAVEEAFEVVGARPVLHVTDGAHMRDAIRVAIDSGAGVIGVAGGDGTVSSAASALVGAQAALLPIPFGTHNHFASRSGIPTIAAAAHAWKAGLIRPVHVGSVDHCMFVNNASCGFYPHMLRHRDRLERVLPRAVAIWLAGMRVLLELPMMRIEVGTPTEQRNLRTPALWVGIGCNSLRLPEPGYAVAEDAVLEAVWGRAETRRAVVALSLRLMRHLKRGLEPGDEKLDVVRARRLTLRSSRSIDIALDGEPFRMRPPLRFELRENALRVVCLIDSAAAS
ncbi:MAG: diacylglycerol/lipid kinase family protein [Gemmatimonadota bacterium]